MHVTIPSEEKLAPLKGHYHVVKREAPWVFLRRHGIPEIVAKAMDRWLGSGRPALWFSDHFCHVVKEIDQDNVICNTGKNAIIAQLAGTNTVTLAPGYGAVGTGAGTPAATDTTLFTESARVVLAVGAVASNVATLKYFFNSSQGNGTLTNMGVFHHGNASTATSSADTGILLSKVAITTTKTSSETLTLLFTLTQS